MRWKFAIVPILILLLSPFGFAQLSPSAKWATEFATQYTENPNLTYRTASNQQLKMDVYYRRNVSGPPVVPNRYDSGGGHGNFSAEERVKIYVTIREFLMKNGVMK